MARLLPPLRQNLDLMPSPVRDRPGLLIRDPFRYADAERRAALHAMLGGIAVERQVLYFTVEEPTPLPVTHRLPVVASRVGSE